MSYATAIGLDVHARSITAVALFRTREVVSRTFGYDPASVAGWILGFPEPKAVYESGVTGFHLARALRDMGVDCAVGAVSKMQKPAADKRRKTTATTRSSSPGSSSPTTSWRCSSPTSRPKGRAACPACSRTCATTSRGRSTASPTCSSGGAGSGTRRAPTASGGGLDAGPLGVDTGHRAARCLRPGGPRLLYIEVRHVEAQKKAIEKRVAQHAQEKRWHARVEALRCMKGIETATAFALVVEAGVFSRFGSARAFSAWLGLVPSEHSSGARLPRGITKAGNAHLRKLLVEASWHTPGRPRSASGRIPRHRPPPHRQSCCGRDSPPRQAQGGLRREAHAPGGRERRHGTGALLLGVGAREDVRGNAVASA